MSRCAAFLRDEKGMENLLGEVSAALAETAPADEKDADLTERLLFLDLLITQREVLSAMLYAKREKGAPEGVLMTRNGLARREPARPMPDRDLWFERVWKRFREENGADADERR